jgi:hypothetical protein
MPFEKLTFGRLWTVDDETEKEGFRTYQDSETKVREDLQYHPNAIRDFLNDVLLPALESEAAAENIGATIEAPGPESADASTVTTVAKALAYIVSEFRRVEADIDSLSTGMLPDSMLAKAITFAETEWDTAEDGTYSFSIKKEDHTRADSTFGYQIWALVGDTYRSDTWYSAGTSVEFQNITGELILKSSAPYSGRITVFGV